MHNDVFEDTALLCQRVNKQVGEVFCSPETVMAKLIQNIFENKLQVHQTTEFEMLLYHEYQFLIWIYLGKEMTRALCFQTYVKERLEPRSTDLEQYLNNLYDLYTRYC